MKAATPKLTAVKTRKRRRVSLDAQLKAKAREIYNSGMADAMKTAAALLVAEKLNEVAILLGVTGYRLSSVPPAAAAQSSPLAHAIVASSPPPPPPVENPCVQCGQRGVYKTQRNRFNLTGSWYCAVHRVLGGAQDAEDKLDQALIAQGPPITKPKPAVIVTNAPAQMRQPAPPAPVVAPAEPPAVDALAAAMGVAELEQA